MSDAKIIPINTIPLPKLAIVMNNFIANTINHLNKLSVKGDEKLAEFDNKLNDLDIMTTLLESKLNSLPEKITSTYPQLEPCNLDDIIPITITSDLGSNLNQDKSDSGGGSTVPPPPPPPPPPPIPDDIPQPDGLTDSEGDEGDNGTKNKGGGDNAENMSPEEDLEDFLKNNESLRNIYKMLKLGVPSMQVEGKARINGTNMELFKILLEKAKKVNPNIN